APNMTYMPDPDFNGIDGLSFRVNGSSGESNVATVFIAIKPVNDAPVLSISTGSSLNANVGETVKVDVSGLDVDEGQTLTFTAAGLPPGATMIQLTATGSQFNWTPAFSQMGRYVIGFRVSDNGTPALSDTKTLTITIDAKWAKTSGPEGGK